MCLDKLHSKLIMHRDLSIENLNVKIKKTKSREGGSKEKVYITLSQFNLAHQLKKGHAVQQ